MNDHSYLAETTLRRCLRKGASHAEVFLQSGRTFSVDIFNQNIERLSFSDFTGIGLRTFIGSRVGMASGTDLSVSSLDTLIDAAIRMAKITAKDDGNRLPDLQSVNRAELEIFDPQTESLSAEKGIDVARSAEKRLFELDERIRSSDGAVFFSKTITTEIYNSTGLSGAYPATIAGLHVSPVGELEEVRSSLSRYSYDRFFSRLPSPERLAEEAVTRTVRLLGARKIATTRADLILDPSCGVVFLSDFFSLIHGDHVNRGSSCLKNDLGVTIAPEYLSITDDGTLRGRTGSRPFDDEGVPSERIAVVENGVLKRFLYDTKAARTAGTDSTGHAHRRHDSEITIGPNNFYIENGSVSPDNIISETRRGLYVLKLLGFDFDSNTGRFSYGASGVWVESGQMVFPVHEVVITANMKDMLGRIVSVGNDLEFRGHLACPTLRIADITIGGL